MSESREPPLPGSAESDQTGFAPLHSEVARSMNRVIVYVSVKLPGNSANEHV